MATDSAKFQLTGSVNHKNPYTKFLNILLPELRHVAMASVDEERLPDSVLAQIPRHAEKRNGGDHRPRHQNFELEGLNLEFLAAGTSRELDLGERQHDGEQEEGEPGERGAEEGVLAEAEEAEEFFQSGQGLVELRVGVGQEGDLRRRHECTSGVLRRYKRGYAVERE